jgi:hypothetical protein
MFIQIHVQVSNDLNLLPLMISKKILQMRKILNYLPTSTAGDVRIKLGRSSAKQLCSFHL